MTNQSINIVDDKIISIRQIIKFFVKSMTNDDQAFRDNYYVITKIKTFSNCDEIMNVCLNTNCSMIINNRKIF